MRITDTTNLMLQRFRICSFVMFKLSKDLPTYLETKAWFCWNYQQIYRLGVFMLKYQQIYHLVVFYVEIINRFTDLLGWIQPSKTGGQLYRVTSPHDVSEEIFFDLGKACFISIFNPRSRFMIHLWRLKHVSRQDENKDWSNWQKAWSCGYGRRLTFWRSWVRFPAPLLDGHFFTLICCKNCNDVCLKRQKINAFFKKIDQSKTSTIINAWKDDKEKLSMDKFSMS